MNFGYLQDLCGLVWALISIPAEGPARPASQPGPASQGPAGQPASLRASQPAIQTGSIQKISPAPRQITDISGEVEHVIFMKPSSKTRQNTDTNKNQLRLGPGSLNYDDHDSRISMALLGTYIEQLAFLFLP